MVVPILWEFLIKFEITNTKNIFQIFLEPRIDIYIKNLIIFGIYLNFYFLFNTFFLIIYFLMKKNNLYNILNLRSIIYVITILIICFFLSPPDFLIQILFLCPLLLFYEFTIFNLILNKIYNDFWKC